jgi:hypothetical protein
MFDKLKIVTFKIWYFREVYIFSNAWKMEKNSKDEIIISWILRKMSGDASLNKRNKLGYSRRLTLNLIKRNDIN